MGAERFDNFIGGSYSALTRNLAADTCVNLYYESAETGTGKNRAALMGAPGLQLFTTLPKSPIRGILVGEDLLFVVAGDHYYQVFADGTFHDRGSVGTDAGNSPVQMFENGTQVLIISAGNAYIDDGVSVTPASYQNGSGTVDTSGTAVTWVSGSTFDSTNVGNPFVISSVTYTVLSVTDSTHLVLTSSAGTQSGATYSASYPVTASCGAYLDGYYIVAKPGTRQFNISAIGDGKSWNPLDFAVKEAYPDGIQALLADHEQLWLFGDKTTEVWQDTGAAAFPFQRIPGAFIQMGCCAAATPTRLAGTVAWLGGDARGRTVAYVANGFIPTRISTHAVEMAWAQGAVGDAVAFAYSDEGHEFWVISFPSQNVTWVYDFTEKLWHQRGWWDGTGLNRVRGAFCGFVFDQFIAGDWESGLLYYQSTGNYDDNGAPIYHERAAPHVSGPMLGLANPSGTSTNSPFQNNQTFYHRFILDMEAGDGSGGVLSNGFTMSWVGQTTVVVKHNLGTENICVQIFDGARLVSEAETVTINDPNTCTLTFGTAFTGSVMVITGTPSAMAGQPGAMYTESFTNTTSVNVVHSLNSTTIIVECFNAAGLLVEPESVTTQSVNNVLVTFPAAFSGTIIVIVGSYTASWLGQTDVIATHNLGTTAVVVQCYSVGGLQVYPESLQVTGINTVELKFASAFNGYVVVWASSNAALPFIILDWSDDGGHNFGVPHTTTTGLPGAFTTRVIWRRLGKSRDRVFRVRYLCSGKTAWINAYLESTAGSM